MASSIVPILIAKAERELVESLRLAGATTEATARPVATPRHFVARQLGRLQREGVIREVKGGLYYLDESAWTAFRRKRRQLVIVMLAVMFVVIALLVFFAGRQVAAG